MAKNVGDTKIIDWLSAKSDNKEKRFCQIGNSFLFSEKVKGIITEDINPKTGKISETKQGGLSNGAFKLYICMAMESAGKRTFIFPKSTAKKYGIPYSNYRRYLKELIEANFIKCKTNNWNIREENIYEFIRDWKK